MQKKGNNPKPNFALESVSNEIRVVAFIITVGTRFIFTKKSKVAIIIDVLLNFNIKEKVSISIKPII